LVEELFQLEAVDVGELVAGYYLYLGHKAKGKKVPLSCQYYAEMLHISEHADPPWSIISEHADPLASNGLHW
jgi:hypothetical protein